MKLLLSSILSASLLFGAALAADIDPAAVPGRGTIAPAFGLHDLTAKKTDEPVVHELDEFCGTRPGDTTAVLVLFVDAQGLDDLNLANSWHKKHSKAGLEVLAISLAPDPTAFAAEIDKARYRFPVLNDRHGIVAHRYGVTKAPFSFLLDQECRVLGFSNRTLTADADTLGPAVAAQVAGQLGSLGR